MSTLTDHSGLLQEACERRFYPRVSAQTRTEIAFGPAHTGTLLDLSENGLSVLTPAPLELNSVWKIELALGGLAEGIALDVRAIWYDPVWQKCGLQFLNLGEDERSLLRAWAAAQSVPDEPPFTTAVETPATVLSAPPPPLPAKVGSTLKGPPARVPIHFFWASAALTFLLGGAWAAIVSVLPEKPGPPPTAAKPLKPQAKPVPPELKAPQPLHSDSTAATPRTSPRTAATPPRVDTTQTPHPTVSVPAPHQPVPVASQPVVQSLPASPPTPPAMSAHQPDATVTQPYEPLSPRPIAANPTASPANHVESLGSQPLPAQPPPHPLAPRPAAPAAVGAPANLAPVAPARAYTAHVLDVPSFRSATYVQLPGESVLRGANVTMHIQRSVWIKANHWVGSTRRKVELGELATHVDPQPPRMPTAPARPVFGSVTVLATIGKDGQVHGVRPLYGSAQLVGSVSTAIRAWRYSPTYVDRQLAETLARIEVDFHPPDTGFAR